MDIKTINKINELSNNRVSIVKDNFIAKINDFQVLATVNEEKYEIDILKDYNLIQKGIIDKNDVIYFLLYFKEKTI